MFIHNLSPKQQGYLFALTQTIAEADGVITKEEEAMLADIQVQIHSSTEIPDDPMSSLADQFVEHKSKVSLLLELLSVAHVDTHYHEKEAGIIGRIASDLQVSTPLLADLDNWVQRQLLLANEAHAFMEL